MPTIYGMSRLAPIRSDPLHAQQCSAAHPGEKTPNNAALLRSLCRYAGINKQGSTVLCSFLQSLCCFDRPIFAPPCKHADGLPPRGRGCHTWETETSNTHMRVSMTQRTSTVVLWARRAGGTADVKGRRCDPGRLGPAVSGGRAGAARRCAARGWYAYVPTRQHRSKWQRTSTRQ
jgi:hypothetical protein